VLIVAQSRVEQVLSVGIMHVIICSLRIYACTAVTQVTLGVVGFNRLFQRTSFMVLTERICVLLFCCVWNSYIKSISYWNRSSKIDLKRKPEGSGNRSLLEESRGPENIGW